MTKLHLIMTKFYLIALFSFKNSNKFRINSNKLGKIKIKLKQAVSKVS